MKEFFTLMLLATLASCTINFYPKTPVANAVHARTADTATWARNFMPGTFLTNFGGNVPNNGLQFTQPVYFTNPSEAVDLVNRNPAIQTLLQKDSAYHAKNDPKPVTYSIEIDERGRWSFYNPDTNYVTVKLAVPKEIPTSDVNKFAWRFIEGSKTEMYPLPIVVVGKPISKPKADPRKSDYYLPDNWPRKGSFRHRNGKKQIFNGKTWNIGQ